MEDKEELERLTFPSDGYAREIAEKDRGKSEEAWVRNPITGALDQRRISPTTGLDLEEDLELPEKEIIIDVSYFQDDDGSGGDGEGEGEEGDGQGNGGGLGERLKKMIEEAKRIKEAELAEEADNKAGDPGDGQVGGYTMNNVLADASSMRINVDRKQRF